MNNNQNKSAPITRYVTMIIAVSFSFYGEKEIDHLPNPLVRQAIIVFLSSYFIFTVIEYFRVRFWKRNELSPTHQP